MTQTTISIASAVISPTLSAMLAGGLRFLSGRRAKLVWYVSPSHNGMYIKVADDQLQWVETGMLILENRSRHVLKNVVIAHNRFTAHYLISPAIEKEDVNLEGTFVGFKFPAFPARSKLTITYLFLEALPGNILNRIYSEAGDALCVPFTLQRQLSRTQVYAVYSLAFLGSSMLLYYLVKGVLVLIALTKLIPK